MGETPLWTTEDQKGRLSELTASTSDPAKELPLRRDVRSLGMLLGRVLVEQSGQSLLDVVEHLRRVLIQQREPSNPQHPGREKADDSEEDGMGQARAVIARLSVEDAYKLTKALSI
jgi:phosphoenolpyruvate carboxylase